LKDYAEYFVHRIDHKKVISHVLHRDHCQISEDGKVTKDLRKIGRDLSKTLIIDNMEENFRFTRDNGIWIPDFIDDFKDDWLYILKDFLLKIA
jgi:TFIIF-interacting CTD phosphatase-like protein